MQLGFEMLVLVIMTVIPLGNAFVGAVSSKTLSIEV